MDEQKKDNKKKMRIVGFIDRAKPAVVGLVAGAIIAGTLNVDTGDILHVPPAALGALASGSTSSTSSTAGIFHHVADTTFDRTYEAHFARLAAEFEQGPAAPGGKFSLRST